MCWPSHVHYLVDQVLIPPLASTFVAQHPSLIEEYSCAADVGTGELAYFLGFIISCCRHFSLLADLHCLRLLYTNYHISILLRALCYRRHSISRHVNVTVEQRRIVSIAKRMYCVVPELDASSRVPVMQFKYEF